MAELPIMTKAQWDALPQSYGRPTPAFAGRLWRRKEWDNCWTLCEYVPDESKPAMLAVVHFRVRVTTDGVFKGAA